MNSWASCKKILCIRADNMGDVLMSYPAIRALKKSFHCHITLLTSKMGSAIVPCLPAIDKVLVYTLPWVKTATVPEPAVCTELINLLRQNNFDAVVIFTVYSQSALPAALLSFMAGIPRRLAYCRENPYHLLTDWVPDEEPYTFIRHQVQRDLKLVAQTGADITDDSLEIHISEAAKKTAIQKLASAGIDVQDSWIVVHTGVSEPKRAYPNAYWKQTVQLLSEAFDIPVLLTGGEQEKDQVLMIKQGAGNRVFAAAGFFTLEEFAAVINEAGLVITVNTVTVHIAAACNTPLIVLYALTNPQHLPWKGYARVLTFSPAQPLHSKNEVIRYVCRKLYRQPVALPAPGDILAAACRLTGFAMPS